MKDEGAGAAYWSYIVQMVAGVAITVCVFNPQNIWARKRSTRQAPPAAPRRQVLQIIELIALAVASRYYAYLSHDQNGVRKGRPQWRSLTIRARRARCLRLYPRWHLVSMLHCTLALERTA
ncbi:hypothetical protein FA95DRAFT_1566815 [Auriscalpium vulgare]|uniref:Uncharacterized protein n=1 Tax=Auriscalpium vulgare TaxID=40419 RepID=A0ACB8R742_9AGAM|nr:hypothetical protein FA95DRAFT_1566815 [Auriscalpium vulgare]